MPVCRNLVKVREKDQFYSQSPTGGCNMGVPEERGEEKEWEEKERGEREREKGREMETGGKE
jgi:hypothetical protein